MMSLLDTDGEEKPSDERPLLAACRPGQPLAPPARGESLSNRHPGHDERIRLYRKRAAKGLPLFAGAS